jgi:hypothetical protein
VTDGARGYGGDGKRSEASAEAAMTEFSSVRGSWPKLAVIVASQKSLAEGWMIGIEAWGTVWVSLLGPRRENRIPTANTMRAYGSRGYANVKSNRITAATTQSKLSPHQGPIQVRGASMFDPALKQSDRPAPIWMPFTTGIGVTRFAQLISPVALNNPTKAATTRPAAAFSSSVNLRAIATAAIAFMGCTGKGIPKATPVMILAAPVNSNVDGSDIEFVRTSAVMSGSSVPKSPKEPDSSASGCDLIVSTLCLCIRRRWCMGFGGNNMTPRKKAEVGDMIHGEILFREIRKSLGKRYHNT